MTEIDRALARRGPHASHHWTAGDSRSRQRGGGVAARGTRAAAGDAGDRISQPGFSQQQAEVGALIDRRRSILQQAISRRSAR